MLTRLAIIAALALLPMAEPVFAQSVQDRIVQQLRDQGFAEIRISRTFLGRTRILATSPTLEREIVITHRRA